MPGYVVVVGTCYSCSKTFSFNPVRVPSIPVQGVKEPVCKECVDKVNPIRITNGLEPITYSSDAYTYCKEEEL